MDFRVAAVIPAYNEERFIGSVVLKTRRYVDIVIVIDDGSSDDTAEIAEAAGAIVVRHNSNRGKGAALNSGFQKARELNAEVVALLDGDGQHRPEDIPDVITPVVNGEADMVIGSRYLTRTSEVPFYRKVGQHVVTFLTNTSSGIPATDSWSGFRAFSHHALECIHFREGGWGVDPEFQFQARQHKLRVVEVPIVALYEEKAKRNPLPHGIKTVNAILRLTGQHRPLLFFGGTGILIFFLGIIAGLWVFDRYTATQELAVGIALISVLLSVIGVVTFFTGISLHSIRGLILDYVQSRDVSE